MVTVVQVSDGIVSALRETAITCNRQDLLKSINELPNNGYNTRDLFNIRFHVLINNRFDLLPLETRQRWMNTL